jgi:hypothetical protein
MSNLTKIVSEIFNTHALATIWALSVIHAMKREYDVQWRHLKSLIEKFAGCKARSKRRILHELNLMHKLC